jgi:predicted nucleic acid-binding protein
VSPARQQRPVAIDTNVFGAKLLPRTAALAAAYEPFLTGRPAFISFVTVAELRHGARRAGWGEARQRTLDARIADAEIVWPGPDLTSTYVNLRAQCASRGHGLSQRVHEADRWVAATALWLGAPLVTHDRVFHDVPGLELLTTLE